MSIKNLTNRAEQLQFLRFIAFFFIFLWHCNLYHIKFMPGGNAAACAVSFFFILSGFVTGYSSFGKETKLGVKEIFKELWKKLKKFYPLYIGITLLSVAYSTLPLEVAQHNFKALVNSLEQLGKNILLIQSWFPEKYFAYCGVGWFLSTIMFIYFFNIPFKVLLNKIKKSKFNYVILVLLFVIIIFAIIFYSYCVRDLKLEFFNYVFPPSRLGEYLSGMVMGFMICMILNQTKNIEILSGKLICWVFTIFEIMSLIFWVYCMYSSNSVIWQGRIVRWLLPNFILLIVFGIGYGYLSKLFKTGPFKMLGNISFECFLLHQFIITFYIKVSHVANISTLGNVFSIGVCFMITIILAYIINRKSLGKGKEINHNSM